MPLKVGVCFSRPLKRDNPLSNVGKKLATYLRFLELCAQKGWQVYILTRRTHQGGGNFLGAWLFQKGKFILKKEPVRMDLIYDRTGGLYFPPEDIGQMIVVNRRDFKVMATDKYQNFLEIGRFMPETFWVGKKENLKQVLPKIKTNWVVLKPFNGLKGIGIYIGPKTTALDFQFNQKYPLYIAQEFVDTGGGIPGIVKGKHDLRVAVINKKVVWCHVRTPPKGEFTANVARGGSITEIDYDRQAPDSIKKIVAYVAPQFYKKYDNPVFSLDFGLNKAKKPFVFEVNDIIGFPLWEMKARERFLEELIKNFAVKLGN